MEREKVKTENLYFEKDLETMTLDALEKYQFEKTKETLERVLRAMQELNYRPNALARGLVTQQAATIGVVIADQRFCTYLDPALPPVRLPVLEAGRRAVGVVLAGRTRIVQRPPRSGRQR